MKYTKQLRALVTAVFCSAFVVSRIHNLILLISAQKKGQFESGKCALIRPTSDTTDLSTVIRTEAEPFLSIVSLTQFVNSDLDQDRRILINLNPNPSELLLLLIL